MIICSVSRFQVATHAEQLYSCSTAAEDGSVVLNWIKLNTNFTWGYLFSTVKERFGSAPPPHHNRFTALFPGPPR